ncbi:hypothetical protein RhiXN_07293 [Rhizoctonia solani]|uniref:Uncharacterized protein n=1 Tax=Rhizoctonia solani TaxID=456999 RepID=A0A8H7IIV4_9AGAM|nr:uncharacterized protein RhiXN_07293 [Rhizoctonia solani]KAF8678722.1 hypothetical protein RHS04_05074 [Rhizoctonia solani]KAF8756551.1 hypothetical protein RHS01_04438 [Rhizoctonia solani]QRW25344.1 hypothetical protein RhiXN_07293 [Rhizoctonia solani]
MFSVFTSVPDTSFYPAGADERIDHWTFRHVTFYALPLQSHGQLNIWLMVIAQSNVTNGAWRYLWLDPVTDDHDGRITGIRVELTDGAPPSGVVAEFKVEESVFETQDKGETHPRPVHYFHYELMAHLRDGFTQAMLLPHTTGNEFQFYLNYMYFLVRAGVINEADEIRLHDVLRTQWVYYNTTLTQSGQVWQ